MAQDPVGGFAYLRKDITAHNHEATNGELCSTVGFLPRWSKPFNLIAVFATKNPNTQRAGPNPLIAAWQKGSTHA